MNVEGPKVYVTYIYPLMFVVHGIRNFLKSQS